MIEYTVALVDETGNEFAGGSYEAEDDADAIAQARELALRLGASRAKRFHVRRKGTPRAWWFTLS